MVETRWRIREYALGDETHIVALFERVFGKPMGPTESLSHWRWEYPGNPAGPAPIELVWDADRLVGQYAASPRKLWVRGRERLAALSLDTMTDPDYGRQGIFSASAEACYARMAERGFDFVYGFPNANSVGGFERRLRWSMIMPTPVLAKPLDVGDFVARKLGAPALGAVLGLPARAVSQVPRLLDRALETVRSAAQGGPPLEVRTFDLFGAWADRLWARCRDQHQVWVIRDASFLRWRYDARPESDYLRIQVLAEDEVVGYAVLTLSPRPQGLAAFVMDLLVDLTVPGAASALLRAIELHARDGGANMLSAMVGPGSPMRPRLLRHAYLPLPERFFPQALHFGARALAADVQVLEPDAWQLSWGDVDVL